MIKPKTATWPIFFDFLLNYLTTLETDLLEILNFLAVLETFLVFLKYALISFSFNWTRGGRPSLTPLERACSSPALTRSRMSSLSNSANTESSPLIARPMAVEKSKASVIETNFTFNSFNSSSEPTTSEVDLPQRSSFQTITMSISLFLASFSMARFHCPHCYKDKIVAFSCKGRTICPSCTGRRTADTAKHLLEEVIPEVPVRQWVLSMPYVYRFLLASRPEFLRKALAIYHRTINRYYAIKAKQLDLKNPKVGAITVIQRFGGGLNLNVHFHTLYTDGVFHENYLGEEVFYEIIPSHDDVIAIANKLKNRLEKLLSREDEYSNGEDHSLSFIQSQSVQNKDENFLAPVKIGKYCDPPFEEFKGTRCGYIDGFSLHVGQ